jgi:hypothetical protein
LKAGPPRKRAKRIAAAEALVGRARAEVAEAAVTVAAAIAADVAVVATVDKRIHHGRVLFGTRPFFIHSVASSLN